MSCGFTYTTMRYRAEGPLPALDSGTNFPHRARRVAEERKVVRRRWRPRITVEHCQFSGIIKIVFCSPGCYRFSGRKLGVMSPYGACLADAETNHALICMADT